MIEAQVPATELRRVAFLGGYEPRRCGIATYTTDLCEAVHRGLPAAQCIAGAMNDRIEGYTYPSRVRFEILERDIDSYRRAADLLNFDNTDVLCVQHEFGIFGGPAGSHLVALLKEVRMPVVTTLHTVLRDPNAAQRWVMEQLIKCSDRLVVMARKGAEILRETYGVRDEQVDVIPHGIPDVPFADSSDAKAQFGVEGRTVLFTFGLLGPGKGIEHAINALPEIVRRHPEVVYIVLGATHPHLLAKEGEQYRLSLERLAEERGMKEHVIFCNRFVSLEDLTAFISATDIYLTPYLDEAQITSGTLAYVFGAGKAVVSTPYWHARELLAADQGILVPFRDATAIAEGVCAYLDDPARLERTRRNAYAVGRGMIWPAVAEKYIASFQRARADRRTASRTALASWTLAGRPYELPVRRFDHIVRMTDGTGIFQHATFNVPNFDEGYCTDDNARAFILCTLLEGSGSESVTTDLDRMTTNYLAFLSAALNYRTGRFRNFMSHSRQWLEAMGSEDSHARALWSLGIGVSSSPDEGHRHLCRELFERGLPVVAAFTSPRAWAFTLLGLHHFLAREENPDTAAAAMRRKLTEKLVQLWRAHATPDWPWFEHSITYENARLCQALLLGGRDGRDPAALEIGLNALGWLASLQTTQTGCFRPIGSDGFYPQGGARADFDQQPVEAQAMVAACWEASRITGDPRWPREAKRSFEWFLGRNDLGQALYDAKTGGCCDGLHRDRVNRNQGAESSLAFQLSLVEMNLAEVLVSDPVGAAQ
ncbi:MAG: glycosyltransferase family 4 protein [Opitutaceae bacterium]